MYDCQYLEHINHHLNQTKLCQNCPAGSFAGMPPMHKCVHSVLLDVSGNVTGLSALLSLSPASVV